MIGGILAAIVSVAPLSMRLAIAGKLPGVGRLASPALHELLSDHDPRARCLGAAGLRAVGRPAPESCEKLARLAQRDPDRLVRRKAFEALESFGPEAQPAVKVLKELLRDPDAGKRRRTIAIIAAMGPAAKELAADTARLSRDKNSHVADGARVASEKLRNQ